MKTLQGFLWTGIVLVTLAFPILMMTGSPASLQSALRYMATYRDTGEVECSNEEVHKFEETNIVRNARLECPGNPHSVWAVGPNVDLPDHFNIDDLAWAKGLACSWFRLEVAGGHHGRLTALFDKYRMCRPLSRMSPGRGTWPGRRTPGFAF
jgi:hypothetical protein